MPSTIVLIVKHATSGGADLSHADTGEIEQVILDGKGRQPKSQDFAAACFWLQDQGYKPQSFQWIDPTGLVRRRRCTYVKEV